MGEKVRDRVAVRFRLRAAATFSSYVTSYYVQLTAHYLPLTFSL